MMWEDKLQALFRDMFHIELTPEQRQAIRKACVSTNETIVLNTHLENWLNKIADGKNFRKDAENDIGYVVESINNIMTDFAGSPMKLASKFMMGKIDAAKLGLDTTRLQAIAEKYAPETVKRLKQSQTS